MKKSGFSRKANETNNSIIIPNEFKEDDFINSEGTLHYTLASNNLKY